MLSLSLRALRRRRLLSNDVYGAQLLTLSAGNHQQAPQVTSCSIEQLPHIWPLPEQQPQQQLQRPQPRSLPAARWAAGSSGLGSSVCGTGSRSSRSFGGSSSSSSSSSSVSSSSRSNIGGVSSISSSISSISSSGGRGSRERMTGASFDGPEGRDQLQQQQGAGKQPTEPPVCDATQLLLGMGLPTSWADQLQEAVAELALSRQHGIVHHSSQVAAHLRSLGVGQQQLVRLVQCCPVLFSWPAKERAAVLFGQLQQLGLTAAEAGKCYEQQTAAGGSPSLQPAIEVLAALYEAVGSEGGASGKRQLGGLLRGQPAAVSLLTAKASTLQDRIANLRSLGLSSAQIVAGLGQASTLLFMSLEHLDKRELLLQLELGVDRDLFAKILRTAPRVLTSSVETLRQRCQALVAVFGKEAALKMVGSSPGLLAIASHVWQTALEVMRLVGVADPVAVAQRNAQVLYMNCLDPRRLVNRLALQRCLGLTAAAVYQQYAGYVAKTGTDRLVGRLLYLEQCGLLPLVEDKAARLQTWRREHGLPANREAPGEPALISLRDVGKMTDADFLSLLSKKGCDSGVAAFQAGLEAHPSYQQLWEAAVTEAARLRAALPPELAEALAAAAKEPEENGGES